MQTIQIKKDQSIWDIALATTGVLLNALILCKSNNVALSDELPSTMVIDNAMDKDIVVLTQLGVAGYSPATGIQGADYGGIGAMGIEIDLKAY